MTLAPLILVVGPSGAGKDSLIDGAKRRLAGDPGIHFARRVVTRAAEAEDHDTLSPDEFARVEAAGGFLLSWNAHGLAYGVPAEIDGLRREGVAVVANVSRSVIARARERLAPVGVVLVTAPPHVLAARLVMRGRETAEAIAARLRRETAAVDGEDVRQVVNDRTLGEGIAAFVAALDSCRRTDKSAGGPRHQGRLTQP